MVLQSLCNANAATIVAGKVDDHVITLKKQDNEKTITVRCGDVIQIELERSSGTGYDWYLDDTYKSHFYLVKDDTEEVLKKGFVGTPVVRRWQFKAINQGEAEVAILLYRSWEGREKAVFSYKIHIKIL